MVKLIQIKSITERIKKTDTFIVENKQILIINFFIRKVKDTYTIHLDNHRLNINKFFTEKNLPPPPNKKRLYLNITQNSHNMKDTRLRINRNDN